MVYGFCRRINQLRTLPHSADVEADAARQVEVRAEQHALLAGNQSMGTHTSAFCD
jgi:hypothetical protein